MERHSHRRRSQGKVQVKLEDQVGSPDQSLTSRVLQVPVNLFFDLLSTAFRLLRPLVPYIVPLAIAGFIIPVLVLFSASAGWYVWKNVAVGWETELYLQYGDGPVPYAETALPPLVPLQPYDISLRLVVPATESNYALGNFMSSLRLTSPANETLTSVRRPALVLPPSKKLPIPFFSSKPDTTGVELHLLSSFVPGARNTFARVELGRNDAWKSIGSGQGRELTVVSASLTGVLVHKGVRGLVTRYPIISASIASSIFLVASFAAFAACMLPVLASRVPEEPPAEGEKNAIAPPAALGPEPGADEKPTRRRRTSRRSRSHASRTHEATPAAEAPESAIPSANDGQTPLRRRRSRLSDSNVQSESD
ncbi:hypothetical protein GLOTRDRAFT_68241 [Gloeophyllum trabeum ATCC 11539]|uniref:Adipose-regulatory protein n=1 Tax=Gloeophyllum trabeum (strain ATCC 11539 / FP-39264 / Madison 617) TaxID=670483 RepID=S7QM50_GLOTA|nr:uncharacterized protein GLOTRDRAFT_68241 [Gloeophyllum trabeum ATCC 11539]EPQ60528.1 hypothetical protein GLOTRDRAFT_68241 [Gloeophyllum trabeum ATCC 11539]